MLQEAILKFRSSGPILLPAIIDNYWLGEIKTYEDYAVLPYEVHEPQPLEKVLDMFEMNAEMRTLPFFTTWCHHPLPRTDMNAAPTVIR